MLYLLKTKEVIGMMGIIKNMHPILLDTIVVSVFALIIFFGVIKGAKKCLISFVVLFLSLFLGFSPYMNSVKAVFAKDVFKVSEWTPAGSNPAYKLGVEMFINLLSSLAVFLLFYVLFHVLKTLFSIISKKRSGGKKEPKSKWGRVFGGLFSLVYQGVIFVIVIMAMNNKFVGMDEPISKSTVTKFVIGNTNKLINKMGENLSDDIVVKLFKGDIFYKVKKETRESFKYLEERADEMFADEDYVNILSGSSLSEDEANEIIKERVVTLGHVAKLVNDLDTFGVVEKDFVVFAEDWLTVMNRAVVTGNLDKVEFSINDMGIIRKNLKEAGVNDKVIALYDGIVEGK